MQLMESKEYRESLVTLRRRGGAWQKAAERAIVMQDDLRDEQLRAKLPVTKHGEKRIRKAVKYSIGSNNCRMVTVQDEGFIFLLYVGTHEDAEKWLDKNRGMTVRVDDSRRVVASFESIDIKNPEQRLRGDVGFTDKPLLSLLSDSLQNSLLGGLDWRLAREAMDLMVHANDDEIESLVLRVANERQRTALFDVLIHLREDDIAAAEKDVRAYDGSLRSVQEAMEVPGDLVGSSDFQHIDIDSDHYRRLIEHYASHADYRSWMLFMHPDQQRFVDDVYAGPAKLSGVSGSGKTCVVVRRAAALAERYPQGRVLVLTLNRSLAKLIEVLMDVATLENARERIEVMPFFRLCQQLIHEFEPENDRLYDDVTWKSTEHIDEIWREYYRCELNNTDARVMQKVHDSLVARGIDAETYIREEFDWIRSATSSADRADYLKMERAGRTYPLDERARTALLEGLARWEEKMRFVGVTDYLGIASALLRYEEQIKTRYRCVLIDESQDFGTSELRLIRRLVWEGEDDVFLCGDAAQQVSSKHQVLGEAGVAVPGARSYKLVLNYRNSRPILEVAHAMLVENMTELMLRSHDFEILDPRYANFSGPVPLMLSAESLDHQLGAALAYASSQAQDSPEIKICISICGYSEYELSEFGGVLGLPVLNGLADLDAGQVFLSDVNNTKGFEFQCMIIVNCEASIMPNAHAPAEETFRDLSRLYVTMTRARQQLIISYSQRTTEFLAKQQGFFEHDTWQRYLGDSDSVQPVLPPRRLEELRKSAGPPDVYGMTGEQYLYQEHAVGCPQMLVEKLRSLISGRRRMVSGNPVQWRTIGEALKSTEHNVRSRQAFGPEGYRHFRERFSRERR